MTDIMNAIKELRNRTGLSAQKFGDKYSIPMRTIQNWESGTTTCPEYVLELLTRAVNEDFPEPILKYILIAESNGDMFTEYFSDLNKAIEKGDIDWNRMSAYDKKHTTAYYVLETINPDQEAVNHFDGNIVKSWK